MLRDALSNVLSPTPITKTGKTLKSMEGITSIKIGKM